MRAIAAKVLDSTHLELTEPLPWRTGSRVAVTVSKGGDEPDSPIVAEPDRTAAPRALRFRERENAWCRTHGDVLRAYAGGWVVLEGEKIIAYGNDPAELVKQAREQGIRSPYVFYVEPPQPGVAKIGL